VHAQPLARLAVAAFSVLGESLTPVRTPVGEAWILSEDELLCAFGGRGLIAATGWTV
jgi:hypothetical protein